MFCDKENDLDKKIIRKVIYMETGNIKKILLEKGIKPTCQRKIVLSVLERQKEPVCARELFLKAVEFSGSLSLATVYRALEIFEEKGIVTKTSIDPDGTARYEINDDIHKHHLICNSCKKILAIEGCPLEEYEKKLVSKTGFRITRHKLNLYGICPDCNGSVNRN